MAVPTTVGCCLCDLRAGLSGAHASTFVCGHYFCSACMHRMASSWRVLACPRCSDFDGVNQDIYSPLAAQIDPGHNTVYARYAGQNQRVLLTYGMTAASGDWSMQITTPQKPTRGTASFYSTTF